MFYINNMETSGIEMRMANLEKNMDEVLSFVRHIPVLEERVSLSLTQSSDHEVRLRNLESSQMRDNVHAKWSERIIGGVVIGSIIGIGGVVANYVL
jgi:hypothetical protein|tara:strand:+ start:422 stop:709 length:288 start_codon:yes stop_codon:yes gene_type:complete